MSNDDDYYKAFTDERPAPPYKHSETSNAMCALGVAALTGVMAGAVGSEIGGDIAEYKADSTLPVCKAADPAHIAKVVEYKITHDASGKKKLSPILPNTESAEYKTAIAAETDREQKAFEACPTEREGAIEGARSYGERVGGTIGATMGANTIIGAAMLYSRRRRKENSQKPEPKGLG